jgi:hypothetical protein
MISSSVEVPTKHSLLDGHESAVTLPVEMRPWRCQAEALAAGAVEIAANPNSSVARHSEVEWQDRPLTAAPRPRMVVGRDHLQREEA